MDQALPSCGGYEAPPVRLNRAGKTRRVGLELELGRLSLEHTLEIVRRVLGGTIVVESRAQGSVRATSLGDFHVEFDHSILKERSYLRPLELLGVIENVDSPAAQRVEASVLQLAAEVVPIEVVTPPVPWDRLHELDPLWSALREANASDTHDSLLHAFGLHLNPEVPDPESATLLSIMRSYMLLEDWLKEESRIDVSRRLSPFIRAFPESYRRKILALDYHPDATAFVNDYLEHNPTRNRPLDLCPLFVHLHGDGILARIDEAHLVKGRPTFHYRLPNCELASPGWTPRADWNRWVQVERLAASRPLLDDLAAAYLSTLDLPMRMQSDGWVSDLKKRLGAALLDRPEDVRALLRS